ncbi:MAG: protein phosphatase 2C domain-containing protein, partial [Chloroflexota bacterium]|nr:protein phosphatase 2C domain-containing protein [Chloroflexota bacterium]
MLEQFQTIYTTQKWVKYSTWLGVLLASALLFWVSGGFPPQPWHFLIQTIALIPHLWILNGPTILLPLAALILLSFTLLFFWLLLATAIVWMVKEQRNYLLERQRFEASLQKAESLASQDLVYQQLWQEQAESIPRVVPVNSHYRSSRQEQVFSPSPSPVATLDPLPPNWHDEPTMILPSSYKHPALETIKPAIEKHFQLTIGTGLDTGIKRKDKPNEDRLLAIQGTLASDTSAQPFGLFVIADGIGGQANGQEASRLATQNIRDVVIPALVSDEKISEAQSAELLLDAVQEANQSICQHNQMYSTDIGTTATAALVVGKTISIANVGDSRTYSYSTRNGLSKVTRDHSVVARLVEKGVILADDVYSHPRRNEIYRSLGHNTSLDVDMFTLPLEAETTLLLCSDGLWEMVRDPEIQEILATTLPDAATA